ncbi:MAG: hypothetical protein DRZ76_03795, partial [Candidatus Nealsonbacteria bacterium]
KNVKHVGIASVNPLKLRILWKTRRGCRQAFFMMSSRFSQVARLLKEAGGKQSMKDNTCYIVITTSGLNSCLYDRRSVIYVYTSDSRLLEPNHSVEVEDYENPSERVLKEVETVEA